MEFTDVPFDAPARHMLPVAEARSRMAATEPLDFFTFMTGPDEDGVVPDIAVEYGDDWALTAPTQAAPVWLTVPGTGVVQLTRQAAQQLGSTCRVNQRFQEFLPPTMLSVIVAWALQTGLGNRELKMLTAGTGEYQDEEVPLAVAQTRATVQPFSNVRLLDTVLLTVRSVLGNEAADSAVVDYKMFHDLEHTSFRLVIPAAQTVLDTGTDEDAWCYGIEVSNSLIGLKQTVIGGYLFRLSSTGGVSDLEHWAGGFNRRGSGPDDVFYWAKEAAGEVLSGLETAFKGMQVLAARPLDGDYRLVLGQLFRESPVSKDLQLRISTELEETSGQLSMYDLACVVSETANLEGASWREVRTLHDLAGHIVHQGGGMCDGTLPRGCRRLLPEDWEAPAS
jgi:hypothetical protein